MELHCPVHGEEGCVEFNTHHYFWPRKAYKSKLERLFRQMHTVRICVEWHKHIHATTPPPRKPNAREMRTAIQQKLAQKEESWKYQK